MKLTLSDIKTAMNQEIILASLAKANPATYKRLIFHPNTLKYRVKIDENGIIKSNKAFIDPQDAIDEYNS